MFNRWYEPVLRAKLRRPFVHVLFGARQTGKSTLVRALIGRDALVVDLADPEERSRHLAEPGLFKAMCLALERRGESRVVFVDEVQSVPSIFDAVQHLYDQDKTRWRFILCGSSARKLRTSGANLLPGRSFLHHLLPLTLAEHPARFEGERTPDSTVLPLPWPSGAVPGNLFPAASLEDRMAFGGLPGIWSASLEDRVDILKAYVAVHLQEEIRREGLVKNWGAFARFIRLAAAESGGVVNYASLSNETGISQPTVKSHYQLLQDMFMGFEVPAFSRSPRKSILSTPKFTFFDLGVRHAAAGLEPSPDVVRASPGPVFEQWVGIELWKRLQYQGSGRLFHQRTKDGAEVDFIVESQGRLIPIEAKWTDRPRLSDARHLLTFLGENRSAREGYVVCRCPHPLRLHDRVQAIPWFNL